MNLHPGTILVIDDEESVLDFIKYNLDKEGYTVTTFNTSRGVIDYVKEKKPDLVISDWMMPGKNGIDLLVDFRRDVALKAIPFIMMTCRNSITDINNAYNKGANDFLVKPFKLSELKSRIHKYLTL
jgi:DNA-binding response OmpR family regulator